MPSLTKIQTSATTTESTRWLYVRSVAEVKAQPSLVGYAHHIIRAFSPEVLGLSGVLCIDGRPTIYFRRDRQPMSWSEANRLQRVFWNQGLATLLVLADPENLRTYSGQALPERPGSGRSDPAALISYATQEVADLLEMEQFLDQVESGHFYQEHRAHFQAEAVVDECLLKNLAATRDRLVALPDRLPEPIAHTLLGRLVFLAYLTDRKIIDWSDYEREVGSGVGSIRELLAKYTAEQAIERLYRLFDKLRGVFNGSMFDLDLEAEEKGLKLRHHAILRDFFSFDEVAENQGTLGFWAYDFSVIPVETLSAIYEDFLSKEDAEGKRKKGAYYTPRHLTEMVIDTAIAGDTSWFERRYLDPSCGSGIFLVTLFNRLASHWVFLHETEPVDERNKALRHILLQQLCGVDIDATACRIACFSLYLAFLDHFEPREIRALAASLGQHHRKVLPLILQILDDAKLPVPWNEDYPPTVRQHDFLTFEESGFDYVIGNPPWTNRGTKQLAWQFMQRVPSLLNPERVGCLLLPAKVFFNKTDDLQRAWFGAVTVERVINLSDFRHILFEHAKCPALIVRFSPGSPPANHRVLYETPKVAGTDPRSGVITIFPRDRKRFALVKLLAATAGKQSPQFWKRHFSGTPRDWRLLDLLDQTPKLSEIAKHPREDKDGTVRWYKGQGIQPRGGSKQTPWWDESRLFLRGRTATTAMLVFEDDCEPVGKRFHPYAHRRRDSRLFEPPLVIASQGFGKVAYCDFPILFQHTLQAVTVASLVPGKRKADEDLLIFLTVYLRSRLARYYLFHTAANWGVERDKVQLFELLHLPFPLPESECASKDASEIVRRVASKVRKLKSKLAARRADPHFGSEDFDFAKDDTARRKFLTKCDAERKREVEALQADLEVDVYRYFDLIDEEIALVEDTNAIIEPSSTPTRREDIRPDALASLKDADQTDLQRYAELLTATLNHWAKPGAARVSSSAVVFNDSPYIVFTVRQGERAAAFQFTNSKRDLARALARVQAVSSSKQSRFDRPRTVTLFDGRDIHLVKPKAIVHWTRTAALNDADEIFAEVVHQRQT